VPERDIPQALVSPESPIDRSGRRNRDERFDSKDSRGLYSNGLYIIDHAGHLSLVQSDDHGSKARSSACFFMSVFGSGRPARHR
jgi:hypothetical protein